MAHKELIEAVERWGENKGITGPNGAGTASGQINKLSEEFSELVQAWKADDLGEMIDAIGDMQVVIILLCALLSDEYDMKISVTSCLQQAYNVISKRTGEMVDGQFVKDEPKNNE